MLKGKKTRKKIKYTILIVLVTLLLSVVYLLADRYLIEHVELKLTDSADGSSGSASVGEVTSDDWNYSSADLTIHVQKVQTGTGNDLVTYFVADVVFSDSSKIKSAFAKDSFGRNIVQPTSEIAENHNAILAINGDYYGFRSDGVLIRNGILYRDEPVRTALALYKDGTMATFDETELSSDQLLASGVINTFSFGPTLVEDGEAISDFGKVVVDTNIGNRSIQGDNPRTGVGMISANHYVFIVVDGRDSDYSKGMTLTEFADLFADLGCTLAYNLDGGGSSTMYFMGRVVNNPQGRESERSVSDILYVSE